MCADPAGCPRTFSSIKLITLMSNPFTVDERAQLNTSQNDYPRFSPAISVAA